MNDNDSKAKQILSIKQNSEINNTMKKVEEKVINNDIIEDDKKENNIDIYNFDND